MMLRQKCIGNMLPQANCHDDKIVIFGMSCVGKTTMARDISGGSGGHSHVCFDAHFSWHTIETMGLSTHAGLKHVVGELNSERFVLDGWHLSDQTGEYLPHDVVVYVLFASYDRIISQYRIPVDDHEQHWPMFKKWYGIDYMIFPRVRYWENTGDFVERSREDFFKFYLSQVHNQQTEAIIEK